MTSGTTDFIARSRSALADETLQYALTKARAVREKSLKHLEVYLAYFEQQVQAAGGQVHWAETPEHLSRIVIEICRKSGARTVTKGKSMVGEEAHLNRALEQAWQALGIASGSGARAVHLITGPSRTADVEQTLQVGAHGPRELLVVMSGCHVAR